MEDEDAINRAETHAVIGKKPRKPPDFFQACCARID
jgi:hypothetical protein